MHKLIKHQGAIGKLSAAKCMCIWGPQGDRGDKKDIFEEIVTEIFANFMETINSQL